MPDQGTKKPPCTEEQATRWLGWLARGMQKHGQTVFLIEQLQPSWLPTGTATWSYSLATLLIGSLIATLALASGFLSLAWFPMRSLVFGIWIGASFGLTSGWRFFQWRQDRRQGSSRSAGSLQRLRRFLVSSLIGVLFAGGTGILIFGPNDIFYGALALLLLGPPLWVRFRRRPTDDIRMVGTMGWSWPGAFRGAGKALLVSALIACFPFLIVVVLMVAPPMIVFGAMFGGLKPRVVEMKAFPLQGIRLSLRNAGLAAVSVGLPVGLTVWRETSSLDDIHLPGLFLGASAALVAALSFGGLDVIYHYLLRLILTCKGYLPRDLVAFLDYGADELHFLQKVGGGYMFIHRYLQEHFAALGEEGESEAEKAAEPVAPLVAAS